MRETHPGLDDVDGTAELVLAPTKRRVEQHLESFRSQSLKNPKLGAELATQLLDGCRPMMDLFDLFHGAEAHQRNELFDSVAETVLQMVISHQRSTGDNKSFLKLLQNALAFASGSHVRERILKNISIGEANLHLAVIESIFKRFNEILDSSQSSASKLDLIKSKIITELPSIASKLGSGSPMYQQFSDSLAIGLRGLSVDANNQDHDLKTADEVIQLALRFAVSNELKIKIRADIVQLNENKIIEFQNELHSKLVKNLPTKSQGSGCLVLFLIPSLTGIPIIYQIIKFLA
jgi:hypothetical protein